MKKTASFIGTKIQNYRLIRLIGEGGMATVYEAVHDLFENRKVAIKILHPSLATKDSIKQRFLNEARLMASLEHKNIVNVIDYEQNDDLLSIIMELLDGQTLSSYLRAKGILPDQEIRSIYVNILDAFSYAHSKGVVHRDVKPSNIYIQPDGTIKILDFGIAKLFSEQQDLTLTGAQIGTPAYMSPEQVNADKSLDHRSDIYSLGVMLYYMVKGALPYDTTTESTFQIYTKIVNEPLPELTGFDFWNGIITKATHKDRSKRFQSCEEFMSAISDKKTSEVVLPINNEITLIDDQTRHVRKTISADSNPATKMNIEQSESSKEPKSDKIPENETSEPVNNMTDQIAGTKFKMKSLMLSVTLSILLILILVLAGIFYLPPIIEKNTWETAQNTNSLESYRSYLNKYPNSINSSEAQDRIDWIIAAQENTVQSYQRYLDSHPGGLGFSSLLARSTMQNLILDSLCATNDVSGLETFITEASSDNIRVKANQCLEDSKNLVKAKYIAGLMNDTVNEIKKKYIGEHLFSCSFIGDMEQFGKATIREESNKLILSGIHKRGSAYVSINGNITIISARKFTFTGTVLAHPADNSRDYNWNGTATFFASDTRAYWRMQSDIMECFYKTGYMDIFFNKDGSAQ